MENNIDVGVIGVKEGGKYDKISNECQFHLTKYSEREGGNLPNIMCYNPPTRRIGFLVDMKGLDLCEEHYIFMCKKIDDLEL